MNRGQRALRAHLKKCGYGELSRLAKALDVAPPTVYGWANWAKCRPKFERRRALEKATGGVVAADLWMTADEKAWFVP